MDSKTIIAIGLMILIYIFFLQPPTPQPVPATQEQSSERLSEPDAAPPLAPPTPGRSEVASKFSFEELRLSNERMQVVLSPEGELRSIELLDFALEAGSEERVNWSFLSHEHFNRARHETNQGPVEWVSAEPIEQGIRLLGKTEGNVSVERTLHLSEDRFSIDFVDRFKNDGNRSLQSQLFIELRKEIDTESQPGFWTRILSPQADFQQFAWLEDRSLNTEFLRADFSGKEVRASVGTTGFSTKYFYLGFVPQNISIDQTNLSVVRSSYGLQELRLRSRQIPPGEESVYEYSFYIGPKKLAELNQMGPSMDRLIEYGNWIGPISRLLLGILLFFYDLIPNYGVAIVLLTIVVKLVLFPLTYKSSISMRKLQIVAPRMKEIRDKYKSNPQRMQAEMMSLYRTEKVNPIGGCLPILLQMPIFFALYRVFFASIEMRHAPFVGWIQDLSAHDPFFVTPVLMAVLMYFQQKLTPMPNAGDESEAVKIQRAMLKWMPIIFGAIMLFLPSGLTLYILVNALVSIIQQLYLNKRMEKMFPKKPEAALKANGS